MIAIAVAAAGPKCMAKSASRPAEMHYANFQKRIGRPARRKVILAKVWQNIGRPAGQKVLSKAWPGEKYLAKLRRIVPSAEKYVKESKFSFMQPTRLSKHI